MLLLTLAPWPYGYYQLLRFVVCGAAVYVAVTAYKWQRTWVTWLFGFIAVLFNPLIPIHLSRDIWQPIDLISAILFLVAVLILKKPPELNKTDKEFEKFAEIADRIVERHNKYGATLTDPRTGQDLLAGMTDEQQKEYIRWKKSCRVSYLLQIQKELDKRGVKVILHGKTKIDPRILCPKVKVPKLNGTAWESFLEDWIAVLYSECNDGFYSDIGRVVGISFPNNDTNEVIFEAVILPYKLPRCPQKEEKIQFKSCNEFNQRLWDVSIN